ncbi:hypothetical protein [Pseudomonas sp. LRF_L74]|uniref:hypothetical protein n=1 Tax=Pseudomonas sp. LRF_L74 TaxID=3369422 RepID=UPI003F601EDC
MKMKNFVRKFGPVVAGASALVATAAANAGAVADAAAEPINEAKTDGQSTGALVVAAVAGIAVVGIIIALVRKL